MDLYESEFGKSELNEVHDSLDEIKKICTTMKSMKGISPLDKSIVRLLRKVLGIHSESANAIERIFDLRYIENSVSDCNTELEKLRSLMLKSQRIKHEILLLLDAKEL